MNVRVLALFALLLFSAVTDAAAPPTSEGVEPLVINLMRTAIPVNDALEREFRRRKIAREFRSNLAPGDPFADLVLPAPFKVYYGGRDARKSWAFAEALVRRTNKERLRVLCTRQYQNSIKDSVYKVLVDMIERLGLDHRFDVTGSSITNPHTGSEFIFKGLQKPAEIKSTEGIDICWVAEAQDTTEESWEILLPTIRKEGSEVWVDFNVTDEEAPTYVRFVKNPPPGSIVHQVNYDSNPFLSTRSKLQIAWLKERDFDAYLHVYEGLPKKFSDALIFKHWRVEGFDDNLWQEAIRKGGKLFFGLDHGFARDPYALIRFFVLDRVLYIEHEAFGVGVNFAGEFAPGLRPDDEKRGELEQLMDSVPASRDWPIFADNSRPETINFLRQKGFNVTAAEKWEGCVEDGIAFINGFDRVVIHPRCKHMHEEARLYSFKVDKMTRKVLPIVVDANDHGWDAIRYGFEGYIQQGGDIGIWAKLGEGFTR